MQISIKIQVWAVIILQYKRQKQKSIENRAGYIKSMISLIMESDGIKQAELAHSLEISNPTMIGGRGVSE